MLTKTISIQAKFTDESRYGSFTDCIYFVPDQSVLDALFQIIDEPTIDAQCQERIDAWIFSLQNQVAQAEPSIQDLNTYRDYLLAELDAIQLKIFQHI